MRYALSMAPVIDPKAVSRAALAAFARRHGVLFLALFGSAARGELNAASDVDVVMDLNAMPCDLPSSWAEVVIADDIIEHLNDRIHAIEEIWRLLKANGLAHIRMPFYGHAQAYRALDHQCYAALDSLDLFVPGTEYHRGYRYYSACRFEKIACGYAGAEIVWQLKKIQTDDGRWEL